MGPLFAIRHQAAAGSVRSELWRRTPKKTRAQRESPFSPELPCERRPDPVGLIHEARNQDNELTRMLKSVVAQASATGSAMGSGNDSRNCFSRVCSARGRCLDQITGSGDPAHRFPDSWCPRSLGRANAHPLRFVASERPFGKQRKAQRRLDTFGGAVALRDGIQGIAPGKPRSQRVVATRDLVENRVREQLPFWKARGDPACRGMSWAGSLWNG